MVAAPRRADAARHRAAVGHRRPARAGAGVRGPHAAQDAGAGLHQRRQRRRGRRGGAARTTLRGPVDARTRARRSGRRPGAPPAGRAVVQRATIVAPLGCARRSGPRCGRRRACARASRARWPSSPAWPSRTPPASRASCWRRGLPAVLISVSGERGPGDARARGLRALRPVRAGGAAEPSPRWTRERGRRRAPARRALAAGKLLPGWAVRLVVGALVLPALLAAIDGFARMRRRRHPVGMWIVWVAPARCPSRWRWRLPCC